MGSQLADQDIKARVHISDYSLSKLLNDAEYLQKFITPVSTIFLFPMV